jgi:predicted transcriptional regulator
MNETIAAAERALNSAQLFQPRTLAVVSARVVLDRLVAERDSIASACGAAWTLARIRSHTRELQDALAAELRAEIGGGA